MGERESSHTRTHGRRDEIKEGDEKRHPANTQKERAERKEGGERSKTQSTCETNEMEGRGKEEEEELANGVSTHTHKHRCAREHRRTHDRRRSSKGGGRGAHTTTMVKEIEAQHGDEEGREERAG